jgi:hypothetical protein
VIVGPSNDASLTTNSPYILTVTAKPEQNIANVMTDTIKIIIFNTPVDCASITVATSLVPD